MLAGLQPGGADWRTWEGFDEVDLSFFVHDWNEGYASMSFAFAAHFNHARSQWEVQKGKGPQRNGKLSSLLLFAREMPSSGTHGTDPEALLRFVGALQTKLFRSSASQVPRMKTSASPVARRPCLIFPRCHV